MAALNQYIRWQKTDLKKISQLSNIGLEVLIQRLTSCLAQISLSDGTRSSLFWLIYFDSSNNNNATL